MIVIHCRSAPPFPVWLNMRGSSKICSPPMVEVITTKMMVGFREGIVIERNDRQRAAPSTTAAS